MDFVELVEHLVFDVRMVGDAVEFEAVAGIEDEGFL